MTLDATLLTAHAAGDCAALVSLYEKAARQADNPDAAGFFLTQAYVFALEAGDARADIIAQALRDRGRL